MNTQLNAMKQWLEAFETISMADNVEWMQHKANVQATSLRTAIDAAEAQPAPVQEPVAWMHWLNGPCRLFMNKDDAMLELDRLNREYPADSHARKMRPLVFGDTTQPAAQPKD